MNHAYSELKSALGPPAYEDEDILLYHGSCFNLLKHVPSKSIHLTVTSPPYNIGKSYENIRSVKDYIEWTADWINLVHRVTAANGAFWLNVGYMPVPEKAKALPIPYLIWDRVPFFLIQEVVWNYGAGVAGRLFFSPRNEKFLWYVKDSENYVFNLNDVRDPDVKYPNQKKNGKLKCNPFGKNPSDVWQIPKVTSGANRSSKERTPHPAQFPLALVNRVILASSNPADIILDPFAGSGSSLEAAAKAGRKAIGFEINKDYINLAISRLKYMRTSDVQKRDQSMLNFDTISFP